MSTVPTCIYAHFQLMIKSTSIWTGPGHSACTGQMWVSYKI